MNAPLTEAERAELARWMNALPFVEWDRMSVHRVALRGADGGVFGWIRRDDGRDDFVVLSFSQLGVGFYTSSAERSEEIARLLWPGEDEDERHSPCLRVEHELPEVAQAVRL